MRENKVCIGLELFKKGKFTHDPQKPKRPVRIPVWVPQVNQLRVLLLQLGWLACTSFVSYAFFLFSCLFLVHRLFLITEQSVSGTPWIAL